MPLSRPTTRPSATSPAGGRRAPQTRPREWKFLTPLALGSMLNPVNSSMIATALVPIGDDLGISPGRTAVLISVLYLACAVAQPTLGRIGEVFGARRVFLLGSTLVAVGAVVGALGTNLGMLVLARVLIGIGTSAAFPNAMLIIRARQLREEGWDPRPSLGVMTVAAQVTTAAGLPIGGLLVELAGWRAVFLFNVPVVALCLIMTVLWIPRDEHAPISPKAALTRIDPMGVVLFTGAIGGVLAAMQTLERVNWAAMAVSLVSLLLLLFWERHASSPFIDVRSLARNGALSRTYLRTGLTYGTTYTMMYAYTQWMQEGRDLDAWVAGLVMVPMTGVAAALTWLLSRRGLIRTSLRVAAVAVTVTTAGMTLLQDDTPIPFLLLAAFGFGIVLGCMSSGNQNALYAQAPASDLGTSAGLYRTATYLGAIGSSALTAIAYADGVDDTSFRVISIALVVGALAVSVLTFADRTLARTIHDPRRDAAVRN